MLAEFRQVAGGLTFAEPRIPVVSNVTGELVAAELTDPDYWVEHVRRPVRFADGIRALHAAGGHRGSSSSARTRVLTAMAAAVPSTPTTPSFVPALRAGQPEADTFAAFLGRAHVAGVPSTGRRSTPAAARRRSTCRPTPSSASGTGSMPGAGRR